MAACAQRSTHGGGTAFCRADDIEPHPFADRASCAGRNRLCAGDISFVAPGGTPARAGDVATGRVSEALVKESAGVGAVDEMNCFFKRDRK